MSDKSGAVWARVRTVILKNTGFSPAGLRASLLEGFNVCRYRLSSVRLPGAVKRLTVVERRRLRRELALQNKVLRKIQHLEQKVQAIEEMVMNYTQKKRENAHSRRAGRLASLDQCSDSMAEADCSSPGFSSGEEDGIESKQSFSA
ncbi:UNVERIFIED_CONTAM: hypothetical protein FKN15_048374 [Acipenser sinensis]